MSDRTLLASVVLFRELYSSEKDVYDVIGEFIKGAMLFSEKWAVNATDVTALLGEDFGLQLPEAVVSTTLHKRMYSRDSVLSFENGVYSTSREKLSSSESLTNDLSKLEDQQDLILERLVEFISESTGAVNDNERQRIAECLCDYLFDKDLNTEYSEEISAFILKNQSNKELNKELNAIREGFVIYDGVRHAPDPNQLAAWKRPLVIFLDTEHLFNATGLNGELYKQLIDEFLNLVREVRIDGKRAISLRYFSDSVIELDRYFSAAEHIVEGKATLDPSRPAMARVVNGCTSRGDIVSKKASMLAELKQLDIHQAKENEEPLDAKYNIESSALLQTINSQLSAKGREFQEDKCVSTLKMFSKLNTLRKGNSEKAFENIGYILLSGSFISHFLAFHEEIKPNHSSIPFSTDLEFVTNRLWFKLQKNLASTFSHPRSLNVLAKAQVIFSSHLQSSVSEKFDQISKDYSSGKITEDDTKFLFNELRSYASFPEQITSEFVDKAVIFLDHQDYAYHLREQSLLRQRVNEGSLAISELESIRNAERIRRKKIAVFCSYITHGVVAALLVTFVLGCAFVIYAFLKGLSEGDGDILAILGILATLIVGLIPLVKIKKICNWFKSSNHSLVKKLSSPAQNNQGQG